MNTLNLAMSSCFKALNDRDSLRLKLALSREFKATSSPTLPAPPPDLTPPSSRAQHCMGERNPFVGQSS